MENNQKNVRKKDKKEALPGLADRATNITWFSVLNWPDFYYLYNVIVNLPMEFDYDNLTDTVCWIL